MRTYRSAIATLSVAFLLGGLAWPHLALRLLQVLIAALALSWVGARIYRAGLPASLVGDAYSPFEAREPDREIPSLPASVDTLAGLLRAADDEAATSRSAIPLRARRIVSADASRRLAEHHGLSLDHPADHARIRALVTDATWTLIRPWTEAGRGDVYADPVPLHHLARILDDLEGL